MDAGLDEWMKDVAPSTELRRWYDHDVVRFDQFANRYRSELAQSPGSEAVERLLAMSEAEPVILITATRDVAHSGAQVLMDHLISLTVP